MLILVITYINSKGVCSNHINLDTVHAQFPPMKRYHDVFFHCRWRAVTVAPNSLTFFFSCKSREYRLLTVGFCGCTGCCTFSALFHASMNRLLRFSRCGGAVSFHIVQVYLYLVLAPLWLDVFSPSLLAFSACTSSPWQPTSPHPRAASLAAVLSMSVSATAPLLCEQVEGDAAARRSRGGTEATRVSFGSHAHERNGAAAAVPTLRMGTTRSHAAPASSSIGGLASSPGSWLRRRRGIGGGRA
jgi:hypothetical protein